jgi:hypothetical protein
VDIIGDRKLKYVVMPGSHDAGMSEIHKATSGASRENTQTQWLNIYNQLVRGSRWFDIRPCLADGGKHKLCHYSDVGAYQGAFGQDVVDVLNQVNK